MPEWLLKEENYNPEADKDTFVNKSILGLLSVISKIRTQSDFKINRFALNIPISVACTFLLVIMLSMSKSYAYVVIIIVYLLVRLSLLDAKRIIKILTVGISMAAFTFIILIPAILLGNKYSGIMITSKVFATVTAVNILSHTTKWNSITGALKVFFVPDIFILVLDITIKYIVMLGEFALNMCYALKLRSVGKNTKKYTALSGIVGTMFIKSMAMAEEMYAAMECRGFTGEYHKSHKFKLRFLDFIYIAMNIGIVFLFIYLERI